VTVVFYISGHGFGHASRDIEVINVLLTRRDDLRVVVRTAARRWLFDLTLARPIEVQGVECDTGVVQIDSLHLDERETIRQAAAFHADLADRAAREARFLEQAAAALVVGDIPPLAFAGAASAGVPSIALGNFSWDWIYEGYAAHLWEAPGLVDTIRAAYSTASLALRLPMSGGFDAFPEVRNLPLIARRSARGRKEVRRALGLPPDRRLVLLSYGGYGLDLFDLDTVAHLCGYSVVTTDHVSRSARTAPEGVFSVNEQGLYAAGYRYEDLVAAVDVVATKPGYGIVAECAANDTAILYTSRGHFVEYDVLVAAMPRFTRCRFISNEELYAGRWAPHLDALLAQPAPPERPAANGAEAAAGIILSRL
jgi:L-arabinokinase